MTIRALFVFIAWEISDLRADVYLERQELAPGCEEPPNGQPSPVACACDFRSPINHLRAR